MAEQQWEHCELGLEHTQEPGLLGKNWRYACFINYCSPNGDILSYRLSELAKGLPFNPFMKAMGLLGAGGWELVSIQHANTVGDWIAWSNRVRVAYFKRPSVPGRAVNEPKLSI
jgi:hypothetical protein